ncbi:LacI family DNA-binding transcriptional regulator [Carboxylicivirga caseinilyticus]|uniref:LacI family DNA-binding transcriptional regulator n=1 Tax=Carboxylicivirga caseinilyticus TaxID=3417572 RepID=UPI003D343917|nr:LacI family DNA-binding transcriptional regulator [Marinilabiliaceae bacterium A049]
MNGRKTRIKDIAEKAGVSIGTVDRVLHNRGEVKAETKTRILEIAKELKYQPNIAARVLKSSTAYRIAVLIPQSYGDNLFWDKHPQGILNGVEAVQPFTVQTQFYRYEMYNTSDFEDKTKSILNWQPHGVIFAPIMKKESDTFCHLLDDENIPYVFIDTFINNTNCLTFLGEDAYQSGRVAASLIDMGITKDKDVLIVNMSLDLENTQHLNSRNKGFLSYFMDAGINTGEKISIEIPSAQPNVVSEVLDPIFDKENNIGAILVSSSRTYSVAEYLYNKGKRDIFLVGYELFGKNVTYLQRRVIQFLIGQRPVEQAEKAFKKLFDYLTLNTIPEKKEFQPIDIVNAENMGLF